jgi:hypothetical protein
MPGPKPIVVFDVQYRSFAAACAAHGYAAPAIRHRMTTHGVSLEDALSMKDRRGDAKKHPNYGNWNAMRSRCYSVGSGAYARYGAKGITMCTRWRDDFFAFVEDMGIRPSKQHSVDRIDNTKGYFPDNCRWALPREQGRNRRTSVRFGKYSTIADAARAIGIHKDVLRRRVSVHGMSPEEAMSYRAGPRARKLKSEASR